MNDSKEGINKFIGCDDPEDTQDDGVCYCNECSMGEDSNKCRVFRRENGLVSIY